MRRLSTIMLAVRALLATKTFPATYTVTLSNPINMTLTNTSATGTITGRTYPATLNVVLSNPTNATLATATGVGTITNNGSTGQVSNGTLFSSLSLLGGNVINTGDYVASRYFQNAFLDSRGFGPAGTYYGGNVGVTLDANGWPTVPTLTVITAYTSAGDGNLGAGTYHSSYQSAGQTTNVSSSPGDVNVAITNIVKQPDGLTTTFDIVFSGAPGANSLGLRFDGPVQNVIVARTGQPSAISSSNPWNPDFLNHTCKFSSIRLMDFMLTNGSKVTSWATRYPYYVNYPCSMEWALDLASAVYNNPGSVLKTAWLNLPGLVDDDYGTQAATLVNTRGNQNLNYIIEVGNEPWNNGFPLFTSYQDFAIREVKALTSFGIPLTISVDIATAVRTSNVLTCTVAAGQSIPNYIVSGTPVYIYASSGSAFPAFSTAVPVTVVNSTTFTCPSVGADTTLAAGTALSPTYTAGFSGSSIIGSVVRASNVITVTLKSGLSFPSFVTNGAQVVVWANENAAQYPYTTAPTTVTVTSSNTLTYPSTGSNFTWVYNPSYGLINAATTNGARANSTAYALNNTITVVGTDGNTRTYTCTTAGTTAAAQGTLYPGATGEVITDGTAVFTERSTQMTFSMFFNITSTLLTFNNTVTQFNTYALGNMYYVRRVHDIAVKWHAVRPQDKFILNLQQYGQQLWRNQDGYEPVHHSYAAWLGGGSATSWLWGVAIAPYFSANSETVAANALADMKTYLETVNMYLMYNHIYVCKAYGLVPVTYEGGPDSQASATIQTSIHTNPQIGNLVKELLDYWFQMGGNLFHFYHITPRPFGKDGTYDPQGAWSSSQSYDDDTSPKHATLLAYQNGSPSISYQNHFGAPGTVDCYSFSHTNGNATSQTGIAGVWYPDTTKSWYFDYLIACPTTKSYSFTLWGTDSQANTGIQVIIDGTVVGTPILPNNGNISGTYTPAACTPFNVTLNAGVHLMRLQLVANNYVMPGLQKVVIV